MVERSGGVAEYEEKIELREKEKGEEEVREGENGG